MREGCQAIISFLLFFAACARRFPHLPKMWESAGRYCANRFSTTLHPSIRGHLPQIILRGRSAPYERKTFLRSRTLRRSLCRSNWGMENNYSMNLSFIISSGPSLSSEPIIDHFTYRLWFANHVQLRHVEDFPLFPHLE